MYGLRRADLTALKTKSKLSHDSYLLNYEKRLGEHVSGILFPAYSLHLDSALLYMLAEKIVANVNVLAALVEFRVF